MQYITNHASCKGIDFVTEVASKHGITLLKLLEWGRLVKADWTLCNAEITNPSDSAAFDVLKQNFYELSKRQSVADTKLDSIISTLASLIPHLPVTSEKLREEQSSSMMSNEAASTDAVSGFDQHLRAASSESKIIIDSKLPLKELYAKKCWQPAAFSSAMKDFESKSVSNAAKMKKVLQMLDKFKSVEHKKFMQRQTPSVICETYIREKEKVINDICESTFLHYENYFTKSKKEGRCCVTASIMTMNQLYEANTAFKIAHPDNFPRQSTNILQMGFTRTREEAEDVNIRKKSGRWDNEL